MCLQLTALCDLPDTSWSQLQIFRRLFGGHDLAVHTCTLSDTIAVVNRIFAFLLIAGNRPDKRLQLVDRLRETRRP